jgi:hypothetical protein
MGNLSFIIPTKKEKEFTLDNIIELLKPNFPELKIFKIEGFDQLRVEDSHEDLICEMWKDECYLLADIDESIKSAEEYGEDTKYYFELKKANLDKENCIQISYGYMYDSYKYRTKIVKLICKEFSGYWLDEGVHPEYEKF